MADVNDKGKGHGTTQDLLHPPKKPCRSCVDFKTWMKQTKQTDKNNHSDRQSHNGNPKTTTTVNTTPQGDPPVTHDCPLDINELGRNTWSFLHTMAANYPDKPSGEEQTRVKTFMSGFSHLYPCEMCAYDFRKRMKKEPVEAESGHRLSQWLCRMHNHINVMLGKPSFDCNKVDERWKDGWNDGSCG